MLQDIPTPTPLTPRRPAGGAIETDRLTLRKPVHADVPAIAALANDRRIAEMTRRLPHPYSPADAASFVASLAADNDAVWLIAYAGTTVGMIGIDWRVPEAPEIGYWFGVDHWGRGFATEAVRAVIDATFEAHDVTHIVGGARVANPASRNVLEKCGFQWTGVELHRTVALRSSTPVDCFRLTRGVWASLKSWGNARRAKDAI